MNFYLGAVIIDTAAVRNTRGERVSGLDLAAAAILFKDGEAAGVFSELEYCSIAERSEGDYGIRVDTGSEDFPGAGSYEVKIASDEVEAMDGIDYFGGPYIVTDAPATPIGVTNEHTVIENRSLQQ